jgi:hypothetical protein
MYTVKDGVSGLPTRPGALTLVYLYSEFRSSDIFDRRTFCIGETIDQQPSIATPTASPGGREPVFGAALASQEGDVHVFFVICLIVMLRGSKFRDLKIATRAKLAGRAIT